jgi:hypothetical protein
MSAGERLVTLLTFPVTIGPNPSDTAPSTTWVNVPVTPGPPPLLIATRPDVTVVSSDGFPVVVTYVAPQASGGTAPITVTCVPQSGSSFPLGVTTVNCHAQDAAGQVASSVFLVTVTQPEPPPDQWHVITPVFKSNGTQGCICDESQPADKRCIILGTWGPDVDQ